MQTLIALRPFRYGTRKLRAMDTFEAPEALARLFVKVGRAGHPPAYQSKEQTPEQAAPVAVAQVKRPRGRPKGSGKGKYSRRDMRAED